MNERTLKLIKGFEKCRLKAYQGEADASGIITIGWGHVITGYEKIHILKVGQTILEATITQEEADQLLEEDIAIALKGIQLALKPGVLAGLTDNQKGALVSFVFNIGAGGFRKSKVRDLLNGEIPGLAFAGFKSWVRSGGQERNGLIRRRAAEMALFKDDYELFDLFLTKSGAGVISRARRYIGLGEADDE